MKSRGTRSLLSTLIGTGKRLRLSGVMYRLLIDIHACRLLAKKIQPPFKPSVVSLGRNETGKHPPLTYLTIGIRA